MQRKPIKSIATTAMIVLAISTVACVRAANAVSIQVGAVRGTTLVPKKDGGVWEFTEDLAVTFSQIPANPRVTISPRQSPAPQIVRPPQVRLSAQTAANTLQIRWRKLPNTKYTVTIASAEPDGGEPVQVIVRTPASVPTPQPPMKSRKNDAYYYGSLEHSDVYPYGIKLPNSGDIDPRALLALIAQHVQFVRFGPTPNEVAYRTTGPQSRESFSFASTDPTIDKLIKNHIAVLYVIDAANAPPWGNPNTVHDKRPIFETPTLYGEFCRGIATHLAAKYPQISRVEIGTNEPNYGYNWTNLEAAGDGMPQFADQTGAGLALYLRSCYNAVKAAAPRITVVAPGIAIGGDSSGFLPFIDRLYGAGCRTGTCWDIFSVHSYTWSNPSFSYDQSLIDNLLGPGRGPGSFYSYRAAQAEAVKDGEAHAPPIMITETGFSSSPTSVQGLDQRVQAYYTSIAFNQYLADPTVRGIVWSDVVNHESGPSIFNGIATYDGLQPKPVFNVFTAFATY